MRKWSIAFLLAFSLLAAVARASTAFPLIGTYKVTITGKSALLNGRWQLKFLPASGLDILRNGHVVVVGRAVVTGKRLEISDRSGSYACGPAERTGVYTYKVTQNRLTFKPVADKCVGRKLILTTKPFVK